MSNIIDSIQLSGTTYQIQGSGGGGNPTVEVTQAEYDAMVTAGTVSADTYYIITDAQAGDLTNYYTKSETNTLLGGKADTATTYTKTEVDTLLGGKANTATTYTKTEVDNAITAATSTKQDTLVSGTNIKTINNTSILGSGNIDIQGGGGDVTTNTDQDITGVKTFVGEKKIKFKQGTNSNKLGFTLCNSASTNNELATFEFRPDTYTDSSSVKHPLLYIGHYRNTNTANAGVVQTMVGFRQYDQSGGAAYHYLMPLPAEAKTPFSLTTSFKNYFAPLGFKNGSTMITADNTGVVDLSSELGGLKLVKLTQTEYDALATKDSNTLYVIVN